MAYQALYRKWRPVTFNDVIGQGHIVNTLKNQITEGKVAHAYLFTGTRGTGKTSTAKIFSRAVNCPNNSDGNPCNECDMCKSILDGSNIDIIEIDAASNTGVANIREIIEQCRYSCATSKYKIYIIDEVHMLSKGAFNALLKTLEEPPSHVIFILATTEIHMVPATILSRCQRFDFSVISIFDISSAIKRILSNENINADDDALEYIAYLGNGSMRDSLSILDRCIAFKSDNITYDDIVSVVGAMDDAVLYRFAEYIAKGDTKSLIQEFDLCVQNGKSLDNFAADMLNVYREMLNYSIMKSDFVCSAKKGELIKNAVELYPQEKLIRCIYLLTDLIRDLRFVSNKRVLIECVLVKLANPMFSDDLASALDRIATLEKKVASGQLVVHQTEQPKVTTEFDGFEPPEQAEFKYDLPLDNEAENEQVFAQPAQQREDDTTLQNEAAESQPTNEYNKIINSWTEIIEELQNQMHLTLYLHISQAVPLKAKSGIVLQFPDKQSKQTFDNAREADTLSEIILSVTGVKADIATAVVGEDSYFEPIGSDNTTDIFSDLAKHSGEFPNNITID